MSYLHPRPLAHTDDLDGFVSHSAEQTDWIRAHGRQSHNARSARVFVVTPVESDQVVAYYAFTMASVDTDGLTARARHGAGRHPQPFALLARLAVHESHEGKGIGRALLIDAVQRAIEVSQEIGCRGLLIHCENDSAREFYLHALPGFEASPTDPLHLMVLAKDLRHSFQK